VGIGQQTQLWIRGGFPRSFLAENDAHSAIWRENFVRTYLERDIPLLGPRVPAETLRRFWTMLAHEQGGVLNAASLARSLGVDGKTVAKYLDLMVDLLLVRRLPPLSRKCEETVGQVCKDLYPGQRHRAYAVAA
jgi:predicted AAA+ superfamily ATPase